MHACCDAFAHTHTHVQNGETALMLACTTLTEDSQFQWDSQYKYRKDSLSPNDLAGTVAQLLAFGANAALKYEVRTCIYVQP